MARSRRTTGAVRKLPSGRWQARLRDPVAYRMVSLGTYRTSREAMNALAAAQTDQGRGAWVVVLGSRRSAPARPSARGPSGGTPRPGTFAHRRRRSIAGCSTATSCRRSTMRSWARSTRGHPERRRRGLESISELAARVRNVSEMDARVPPLPKGLGTAISARFGVAPSPLRSAVCPWAPGIRSWCSP